MTAWQGKQVLLGVSGGIAAYRAAELVRLFVKAGASVNVVMTRNATEFITPLTMQTLSGNPVLTDTFDREQGADIKHVSLPDEADVIVLAPATANLIGKLANGIADDLLTTALLVARCPIVMAPAMNVHMWDHPVVQENLARVRRIPGLRVVEPVEGLLACGWEGKGKLAEPEAIFRAAGEALRPRDLSGRSLVLTAGPTREFLDPVRYLSNPSTGKMGLAIAEAAAVRGADVTVVLGPTAEKPPAGVRVLRVESAADMFEAARAAFADAQVFIASAAVADYTPAVREDRKVKKSEGDVDVRLTRTTDILKTLAADKGERIVVGFAAETNDVVRYAREKLVAKNCDLVVANDVTAPGSGFAVDTNRAILVEREGETELPLLTKREIADRILDRVVELLAQGGRIERPERHRA